jgi:hypothetical protein
MGKTYTRRWVWIQLTGKLLVAGTCMEWLYPYTYLAGAILSDTIGQEAGETISHGMCLPAASSIAARGIAICVGPAGCILSSKIMALLPVRGLI